MADEFQAFIGSKTQAPLEKLERVLCSRNQYVVEARTQAEITFRYAAKPRRTDWPEDFSLSYDGENMLLTIHAGSKSQRDELVRTIQGALSQIGITACLGSV